jgi:hypothetical protein
VKATLIEVLEMREMQELSHYRYWLTKEVWPLGRAVVFIVNHFLFQRSWEEYEDFDKIVELFYEELMYKLKQDNAEYVFCKISIVPAGYDDQGVYVESKLDMDNSDVIPSKFIKWLHDNRYAMPYEFKAYIGEEDEVKTLTIREQDLICKNMCQAIAKTLWDINANLTIKDIREHKAIQQYGDGKLFDLETTLHRWISDVDPRKVKTGKKKQL